MDEHVDPEHAQALAEAFLERKKAAVGRLEAILGELGGDPEVAHLEADKALLDCIGDDEVRDAFEAISRWYA